MTRDDTARLIAAQQARIADLRELTADKPPHRAYLEALLAASTRDERARVDPPRGVAPRVANALYSDVAWCRADTSGPGQLHQYPGEYAAWRRMSAVRAARAASTRRSAAQPPASTGPAALTELLNLNERTIDPST